MQSNTQRNKFDRAQDFRLPLIAVESNQPSWVKLHNEAIQLSRSLKKSYQQLLLVLIEIEREQVYFHLEVTSLFQYCVRALELPKHTAYDFIDVVRTSKEIPELAEAIVAGRTTISKARRICSVITPKNKTEWINAACECSFELLQKMVAQANPSAAVQESLKYVSGDVLELKLAVSEEWAALLKETKDLLSQKHSRSIATEEAIFILMRDHKEKNDPVKRAERAQKRKRAKLLSSDAKTEHNSAGESANESENATKRQRPMSVEHEVELRDRNQCTWIDRDGERCESKRWLEKHHKVEFSKGGKHTLENLETLCSAHHRIKHMTKIL